MSIRIITDSASDITRAEMEQYQVELIPIPLLCGEKTYMDDKTMKTDFFWKMLMDGENIKTSLPSPDSFLQIFEEAKEQGDEVICILISSGFSGTYQSAVLAKSMAEYDKIYLVDSKCAAAAEKMVVFRACELRKNGLAVEEIAADLETFRKRVHLIACLDTLEYLKRGGRLSGAAASIGNMLKLKPIITFSEEGEILVVSKARGTKKALKEMTGLAMKPELDEHYPVIPIYAQNDANCREYMNTLHEAGFKVNEKVPEGIGATIGTYIGPGGYGIVYVEKEHI